MAIDFILLPGNTYITNHGLSYLSYNRNLRDIDLSCTAVSEDGILKLNTLPYLRMINMKHTLASQSIREELKGMKGFEKLILIGP